MALTILDAGVLIGVLDANDVHHQPALHRLRELLDAGAELAIPVSVYAEILVGPFRHGVRAVEKAEAFIADIGARIEAVTPQIGRAAAALRATHGQRLRLPDALVIATAQILRADRVVTTDVGWPRRLPVTVEVLRPRTRQG